MDGIRIIEGTAFGGPDVLVLKEVPSPTPEKDALLIDVEAAGVNYLDLAARAGFMPAYFGQAPFRLGFEIAGVVKAVGADVATWKPGDRAAALTMGGGGYASRVVVPASAAIQIPDALESTKAAAILVQGLTAFRVLELGNVRLGTHVLVSAAAGGVGAVAVQIAKLQGAKVIGLASPTKHAFVLKNGADQVFDYRTPGWSTLVREAAGEHGVDVFLDSVGDLQTEGFDLLGESAHWIVYGARSDGQRPLPAAALWPVIEKNITLRGFNLGGHTSHFARALSQLFDWTASGRLKLETRIYPLAEAARAHRAFEAGETMGKVLLVP